MLVIDGNAGFEELSLLLTQINRQILSRGSDKLTFTLLDVSQALSEQFPAALGLLDGHPALLEPLGDS